MEAALRDLVEADIPACAAMATESEIGRRYGFTEGGMSASLGRALADSAMAGSTQRLFAATSGAVLGFVWMDLAGAFSSAPYLRLIAVAPGLRGSGIGSLLLAEFERRGGPAGRDFCLLVSDFNTPARDFYARHGYREIGVLEGFARPGIGEVIMVKPRPAGGAAP